MSVADRTPLIDVKLLRLVRQLTTLVTEVSYALRVELHSQSHKTPTHTRDLRQYATSKYPCVCTINREKASPWPGGKLESG